MKIIEKGESQILQEKLESKDDDEKTKDVENKERTPFDIEVEMAEEFFQEKSFRYISRDQWPRSWAIKILLHKHFETVSISIILLNCVTLGLFDPFDSKCLTMRCQVLEALEITIYFFFLMEMLIKFLAMGLFGPLGYFKESWNRMDFFIVAAGTFEIAYGDGEFLSSIRAIRVLRPLRAINRVPSIRILVTLLLDTLPMLGNVLAICMLIFAVFGIIGVQLWQGVLRNRCYLELPVNSTNYSANLTEYYSLRLQWSNLCSLPSEGGLAHCTSTFIPNTVLNGTECTARIGEQTNDSCINWNSYYTSCRQDAQNPYYGITTFDHFGFAFIAIFQVITLEGWSQVMYFLQDTYSPWVWIYFVVLIIVGSYFMTNLCLVVIATQFSETRQRESALIEAAMKKSRMMKSYSTLASSDQMSQGSKQGCYQASLLYIARQIRRGKRRFIRRLENAGILKKKEKKKQKLKKRRKPNTNTIHLHHHHHHHIHHHHHHSCSGKTNDIELDNRRQSGGLVSFSPTILPTIENPILQPTTTLLQIEGQNLKIESPHNARNTSLLLPETTVMLCRSKPTIVPTSPTNHTVSFFPGSYTSSNLSQDKQTALATVASSPKVNVRNLFCTEDNCPRFHNKPISRSDMDAAKYEYHYESQDDSSEYEDDDDEDDDDEVKEKLCTKMQRLTKLACDSNVFKGIIMGVILMNTLTMAIEHHNQPVLLTKILDAMNMVFTWIFGLEFLMKLYGYGLYGYVKEAFNLFDCLIVVVSFVELFGNGQGSVSVLRTFRLMRVFKLIRFLPSLQKQISVMIQTLDSVMTFLALLTIFMFTAAILGMQLLGAKMFDNGKHVRHNFDNLLWSLLTVFQVLTQEDWNKIMHTAMRSTSNWAAVYFILLMTIGNYILFNLLVAILVEGFSTDAEDEEGDETSQSGTAIKAASSDGNMAAICAPSPTTASQRKRKNPFGSRHKLENSVCSLAGVPGHVCVYTTSMTKRNIPLQKSISDAGPDGRNCHVHQKYMGRSLPNLVVSFCDEIMPNNKEEKSMKEEKITEEESEVDFLMPSVQPPVHHSSKIAEKNNEADQVEELEHNEPLQIMDKDDEEEKKPRTLLCCGFCIRRRNWTFYLLSPTNRFRCYCKFICNHKWFDRIVLLLIFLNCIVLAMERPGIDPNGTERKVLDVINNIFTVLFTLELMIKVLTMCFIFGDDPYLDNSWNRMDCFLVIVSLIDLIVSSTSDTKSSILGVLKVFRAFRTLRPLRVISRAPGLKIVVETLITSLKPIGNLLVIALVFFTIFAILGVQLFKGAFYYCSITKDSIMTKDDCIREGGKWQNQKYNFDNLVDALLTLFVFSTKDGWAKMMHIGIDSIGVDMQPKVNNNPMAFLYFIAFLLLAGFVVINMVVGVIIDNFQQCQDELEKLDEGKEKPVKEEEQEEKLTEDGYPFYCQNYSKVRKKVHSFAMHYKFDLVIAGIIGLNILFMAIEYYNMPPNVIMVLKIANFIFTTIFIIESGLKIYVLGFKLFFSERWNQMDIIIVILSIVGIALEELNSSLPINPTIIRIMRVLRIARVLKILKAADGIQKLLNCVLEALPQVGNLSMLFLLLIFIFSSLGIELFGTVECRDNLCQGMSRHAHFRDFPHAMLTLFRISTADSWSGIMKDTLNKELCKENCGLMPIISPIYFAVFVLATQFVLVNVVVAVLMKQLEDDKEDSKTLDNNKSSIEKALNEQALCEESRQNSYSDFGSCLGNMNDSIINADGSSTNEIEKQDDNDLSFTYDFNDEDVPLMSAVDEVSNDKYMGGNVSDAGSYQVVNTPTPILKPFQESSFNKHVISDSCESLNNDTKYYA